MKHVPQKATYTVEYWTCTIPTHHHKTRGTALACVELRYNRKYTMAEVREITAKRKKAIMELTKNGMSLRRIAKILGISASRVAELRNRALREQWRKGVSTEGGAHEPR